MDAALLDFARIPADFQQCVTLIGGKHIQGC